MVKNVGVWIDEKKAVIVTLKDEKAGAFCIASDIDGQSEVQVRKDEKTPYESRVVKSGLPVHGGSEVQRRAYYNKIIDQMRDARYVFIFGPGPSKRELRREILKSGNIHAKIAGTQPAEEMTLEQIAERVRRYFVVSVDGFFPAGSYHPEPEENQLTE